MMALEGGQCYEFVLNWIYKSLFSRGRTLNLKGSKIWVPLTYEKLPRICFRCNRIVHSLGFCEGKAATPNSSNGQFGSWLRAMVGQKLGRGKPNHGNYLNGSTEKIESFSRDKSKEGPPGGAETEEASESGKKIEHNLTKNGKYLEDLLS